MANPVPPAGQSQIKVDNVFADDSKLINCCSIGDICDMVRNDQSYPYKNDTQTARYYGVPRQNGLMKLLGMQANYMAFNEGPSYANAGGGKTFEIAMPAKNGFQGGGSKVIEMPMNASEQRIRTGFKDFRASTEEQDGFRISQTILDLTMGAGAQVIPAGQNDFVLPPFYAIYGSDDACVGCAKACCADGARNWFIRRQDGRTERVWVMDEPPAGVVNSGDYGLQQDGSVKLYVIRGVAQNAQPCATDMTPDDYGAPLELKCGDTIEVGGVVTFNKCGCLPCATIKRREYTRTEFRNFAERITDELFCMSQTESYRNTYLEEPNKLKEQYRRNLQSMMTKFAKHAIYGISNPNAGAPLTNAAIPGIGDANECNEVPFMTDGIATLVDKHGRKMDVCLAPGCNNRCALEEMQNVLTQLIGDTEGGNPVLIGTDYLMHMVDHMIRKEVHANDFATANQKVGRGVYQAMPGVANGVYDYELFKIGNRSIPFILDYEIMDTEPDTLYLLWLDAIEFWHPNNQLDKSMGWLESTARSGSLLPVIYTNEKMTSVSGENRMISEENCLKKVKATIQFGVWYTPMYYPQTFKIKFAVVDDQGNVTTLAENPCGCSNNGLSTYRGLRV